MIKLSLKCIHQLINLEHRGPGTLLLVQINDTVPSGCVSKVSCFTHAFQIPEGEKGLLQCVQ